MQNAVFCIVCHQSYIKLYMGCWLFSFIWQNVGRHKKQRGKRLDACPSAYN